MADTDASPGDGFNSLLRAAGIDPAGVRLLRHPGFAPGAPLPCRHAAHDAPKLAGPDRRATWAGFWAEGEGEGHAAARFAGLFAAVEVERREDTTLWTLTPLPQLADHAGRLRVLWGTQARAWIQRADRHDKPLAGNGAKNGAGNGT